MNIERNDESVLDNEPMEEIVSDGVRENEDDTGGGIFRKRK